MNKFYITGIILVILLAIAFPMTTANTIVFDPTPMEINPGQNADIAIKLDSAPSGISGYRFNVAVPNTTVAHITGVTFPGWAALNETKTLPDGNITLTSVDLSEQVQAGASEIVLATIQVQGEVGGSTKIRLFITRMDDDNGATVSPDVGEGEIIVGPVGYMVSTTSSINQNLSQTTVIQHSNSGSSSYGGAGGSSSVAASTSAVQAPAPSITVVPTSSSNNKTATTSLPVSKVQEVPVGRVTQSGSSPDTHAPTVTQTPIKSETILGIPFVWIIVAIVVIIILNLAVALYMRSRQG